MPHICSLRLILLRKSGGSCEAFELLFSLSFKEREKGGGGGGDIPPPFFFFFFFLLLLSLFCSRHHFCSTEKEKIVYLRVCVLLRLHLDQGSSVTDGIVIKNSSLPIVHQ